MANLDIAERRLPQDGRIELNVGGNPVDLRVSVLPTMFGESVVMRVLDRTVVVARPGQGRHGRRTMLAQFRELIHKPNGIVLVTGPTGSGKTTTLYSALNELNDDRATRSSPPKTRSSTTSTASSRCPINPEIGLTFAACLRAILRQDPDKILVGEIRDLETAADRRAGVADRAHGVQHAAHQRRPEHRSPACATWACEPFLITATRRRHPGPAAGAQDLHELPDRVRRPAARSLMELDLTPERRAAARSSTTARAATSATTPATRAAWASTS